MNKSIDALKLALGYVTEALEHHDSCYNRHPATEAERNMIVEDLNFIREALAHAPTEREQPAQQQELPDFIAGALGVSRGTAYDLMREALAEQPAQQQEPDDSLLLCASDLEHSAIYDSHSEMQSCIRAVASRIKALATSPAQQEPVAFEIRTFNATQALIKRADVAQEKTDVLERGFGSEADVTIVPLYTSPPANANAGKPWQGLTDEDIGRCFDAADGTMGSLIAAIEAKLRERNEHREKNA